MESMSRKSGRRDDAPGHSGIPDAAQVLREAVRDARAATGDLRRDIREARQLGQELQVLGVARLQAEYDTLWLALCQHRDAIVKALANAIPMRFPCPGCGAIKGMLFDLAEVKAIRVTCDECGHRLFLRMTVREL
jgi:hypothetical protein